MISGCWRERGLGWMDARTACGFDMAGNSIVFDIAEEILAPSRAGEISSGLFLSILWDKIKHTSIPRPISRGLPPSRQEAGAACEPGDSSWGGVWRPGLRGRHRTIVLRCRKGVHPQRAGMGVAWSVWMKHAHPSAPLLTRERQN